MAAADEILNLLLLSWPADWRRLFGRSAPLEVEIGFGSGAYLRRLAAGRPNHNFLGVEISLPSLRRARRKLRRQGRLD